MATNDDQYEYVTGTYKYKKGLTPDESRETAGAWRGTLRDDAGHLDGHAEFIPGDPTGRPPQPDPEPVYVYVTHEHESHAQAQERAGREELLARLAVLGVRLALEKAGPHVMTWWSDQALPTMKSRWSKLARRRTSAGEVVVAEPAALVADTPEPSDQEVVAALDAYKAGMSSVEARDRFIAALVARLYSEEQLRLLRDARVEPGDGPRPEERVTEAATAQAIEEGVAAMLEGTRRSSATRRWRTS